MMSCTNAVDGVPHKLACQVTYSIQVVRVGYDERLQLYECRLIYEWSACNNIPLVVERLAIAVAMPRA